MWQVMLAAAVAGSGFFAKRFLSTTTTNSDDPNIEADTKCDQSKELQQHLTAPPSKPQLAIPLPFQSCNDCKSESETQSSTAVGDGSIFMFSSHVSKGGTGSRFGSKKSGGNREGFKTSGFEKVERKCGGFDQSKSGKKFAILGPDSGWQRIPLAEVITSAAVKKAYRKATLCVHPDKLQQRGASVQQKYICEKVFDLL
ncbi:hypothetical protein HYC85_006694 [Camellia sinensis]|uniref:J domain-containing protein n=1 Tax=Camellia sinensis TaxID=4442 RepID=A0A7J7HPC0_CAMSI|nr:hypothetical protein HYC85_006694 [Camellia sinensis]